MYFLKRGWESWTNNRNLLRARSYSLCEKMIACVFNYLDFSLFFFPHRFPPFWTQIFWNCIICSDEWKWELKVGKWKCVKQKLSEKPSLFGIDCCRNAWKLLQPATTVFSIRKNCVCHLYVFSYFFFFLVFQWLEFNKIENVLVYLPYLIIFSVNT